MFSFYDEKEYSAHQEREIVEVSVKEAPKKRRYYDFDKNYEECA